MIILSRYDIYVVVYLQFYRYIYIYLKCVLAMQYSAAERGVWAVGQLLELKLLARFSLRLLHCFAISSPVSCWQLNVQSYCWKTIPQSVRPAEPNRAYDFSCFNRPGLLISFLTTSWTSGPLTNHLCIVRPLWLWLSRWVILWPCYPCFTEATAKIAALLGSNLL